MLALQHERNIPCVTYEPQQANVVNIFSSVDKFPDFIDQYTLCIGDDLNINMCLPPKLRHWLISLLHSNGGANIITDHVRVTCDS